MKQLITSFGLAVASLAFVSCQSNGFKVEGVAEGFEDGDTLFVMEGMPNDSPDTLIVKDGKFSWEGNVDSVTVCTVIAPKAMKSVMLFKEPGTIHVLLSATGDSEVSGTTANDALQELNVAQIAFQKKAEALISQLYEGDVDEERQQAIYTEYESLQKEMGQTLAAITKKNLDNELGYFLLTQLAYSDVFSKVELHDLFSQIPSDYQKRQAVKDIQKMLEASFTTEEGDQIPDFKMQSSEGNEVSIMDEVKKNKITVLDFWASWCQPCREEMPVMKQILADNQEKGFGIVGISLDDNRDSWINCIQELELSWPQMSDLQGGKSIVAQSFGVTAIPFTAVVDQNGVILSKGLRGEDLAKFVSEQLK